MVSAVTAGIANLQTVVQVFSSIVPVMVADATFGMGNAAAGRACSLIIAIFGFVDPLIQPVLRRRRQRASGQSVRALQ
jgi:hypothetical protein